MLMSLHRGAARQESLGQLHLAQEVSKARVFMQCLKFLSQLDEMQAAEAALASSIQPFESLGTVAQGRVNSGAVVRGLEVRRLGEFRQFLQHSSCLDMPSRHGVHGSPESPRTQVAQVRSYEQPQFV